ncbi:hypothetical protein BH11PSE10_BH11PSE10_13460 [soil metagenome]
MGWGDAFAKAYQAASDVARMASDEALSSARAASAAVGRAAQATAQAASRAAAATKQALGKALAATEDFAEQTLSSAKAGALATAHGAGNLADFGGRATVDAAHILTKTALLNPASAPYKAARALFSPTKKPTQTAVVACPNTVEAKRERLEQRNQLIKGGSDSPNPAARAAADRLNENNQAVELARLSDNSYAQYPNNDFEYPNGTQPPAPLGWDVVSRQELETRHVNIQALEDARAVVYRTPDDWPGGPKTVVAFRGTADLADGIVDHDQAMAVATTQYKAAMLVGDQMSVAYGPDLLVTGHSLGGGKAQAAGAAGGLKGTMFNAAGLNPDTVGSMMPDADLFTQYRSSGDPLTGAQNSPATQTAIGAVAAVVATPLGLGMKIGDAAARALGGAGLSPEMADYADKALKALPRGIKNIVEHGNLLPPAIGAIHEVPAIDDAGVEVSRLNLPGQHSMGNVINGIEQQKSNDVATLCATLCATPCAA